MKRWKTLTLALGAMLLLSTPSYAQEKKDIVDTAVGAGQFNTLAKALTEAGLVDTLKGDGPFTVFAPTDEAFAKLPEGTLESLLQDTDKLKAILTYHVVPGRVLAKDVVQLSSAKTVQGSPVNITVENGKVKVNQANVIKTDIEASNGVIHVIDSVLLPPQKDASAKPMTAPSHPRRIIRTPTYHHHAPRVIIYSHTPARSCQGRIIYHR